MTIYENDSDNDNGNDTDYLYVNKIIGTGMDKVTYN
jgi:hypothetical protein